MELYIERYQIIKKIRDIFSARNKIHRTASVGKNVQFGGNVKVWQNAHIRENSKIGKNCVIGENVYIGESVEIGDNCKIQNNALIYEGSKVEQGVFIGPGVILTNDKYPKAVNLDLTIKESKDWVLEKVVVKRGASIGAGSICIAPVIIGEDSMIGAGSVVTKNVPDQVLVFGNPARLIERR